MSKAAVAAVLWLTAAGAVAQDGKPAGDNWANWRGPLYTGVSPQGDPPIEWSEEKNIRWKVAIPGKGSASPVIWGDKLFLLTAVPAGEPAANVELPEATEPVSRLDKPRTSPLSLGRGAGGEGRRLTQAVDASRRSTASAHDDEQVIPQGIPSPLIPLPRGEGDRGKRQTHGDLEPVALLQPERENPPGADRPRRGPGEQGRGDRPGRGGPGGFGGRGGRGGFGGGPAPTTPYEFRVLCLDRNTGKTIWSQTARKEVPHESGHNTNTFASASVVTDGKLLYASFGSRGLYCYDLDGKKVWETDLGEMQTRGQFGEGATPALHGDTLVVPWDHEGDSFVVALDAKTGDEKWRVDRDEPTTWATPLVVPRGDGFQVVLNGTNRVRSYDLKTGKLLWECGGQAMNPIPTPVADDERVYVMTGFRGFALYAIPLDATGDLTDTDRIAWKLNEGTPYISSPVLSKGLLYITKDRNAILSCIEAETGEEVYAEKRLPGLSTLYSSPVAASGRLYFFSREGAGVVIKEGREFEVLAENQLDETIDASPAIIGDVMYVRGEKSLYAIAEKK